MPRTLAGRYRLERRLGRGGMGTVYEAVDVALDRRVAVKVVRDEWVHNAMATQRFRREARAVAGFAHPNVVTVYDYGVETGARVFLVMELLSGTTLRDELRRGGRLDAARTLDVLRGVCSAVDAAHQRGFIHRDLKPENIFLVAGNGPVKVLDFGVAKPLVRDDAAGAGEPPETEVGVLVGTVGYISPEQLLGDSPDVSWDVWALATVAYESLTGALPFPVESRESWRQLGPGRPVTAARRRLRGPAATVAGLLRQVLRHRPIGQARNGRRVRQTARAAATSQLNPDEDAFGAGGRPIVRYWRPRARRPACGGMR